MDRERADAAEKLVQEKSELLDVVAHELRTPLTGIKGNLDLATRLVGQGRHDTLPVVLSSALRSTDHLGRVMRDLLDAGNDLSPTFDHAIVDLRDVGTQACDWSASPAGEKRIALECVTSSAPCANRPC